MKIYFIIIVIIFAFWGCNSVEPNKSSVSPLPALKIDKIEIDEKKVKVTVIYGTATPCWYYLRSETTINDFTYKTKVFGKYDGEICIQVLGSITKEDRIFFTTAGEKRLKFWKDDNEYLDTVITIQ